MAKRVGIQFQIGISSSIPGAPKSQKTSVGGSRLCQSTLRYAVPVSFLFGGTHGKHTANLFPMRTKAFCLSGTITIVNYFDQCPKILLFSYTFRFFSDASAGHAQEPSISTTKVWEPSSINGASTV